MSVTVADCLKLPALREANVLAGHAGLIRPVSSLSVIEYPDMVMLSQGLLAGNEILISALIAIKDDVDAQCLLIRHLHSMGEAGLVLYYVGVFVPRVDERLLKTADEIDFPLIVMPVGRTEFRYCDAIMEILELIIADRKQKRYYVSEMVNRISLLQAQFRTMNSVLRLLSDELRCTLLLADRYLVCKAAAAWPNSRQWDYPQILETLKTYYSNLGFPIKCALSGSKVTIWDVPVTSQKYRDFHLYVLDEQDEQNMESVQQAAEVVELFLNIWNEDTNYEGVDALVHAVLSDQPEEKERIVSQLHIDISSIHTIWILRILDKNKQELDKNQRLNCVRQLNFFLKEHHKQVIVDSYAKYLVVLTDDLLFDEESEILLAQEFVAELQKDTFFAEGTVFQMIDNTSQARDAYILTDENLAAARIVYPEKSIYSYGEIRFVQSCREILSRGEAVVNQKLSCLEQLYSQYDREDLFRTLATYLLDANTNLQQTGDLLYLHKNTIKYRLNKIKAVLNCDLVQMPESFELYQATALQRLLNPQ